MNKHYLLVSDFDQTLSFNDSGDALSEMLGISGFKEKVEGLSRLNLVQSGAELTYLLRHDPEYRRVRREDIVQAGRHIPLKRNIAIVFEALDGIVPRDHIIGTKLGFERTTGEVESALGVAAGYGKVAAVEALRTRLGVPRERVVYVGDGSSIRAFFESKGLLIQEWDRMRTDWLTIGGGASTAALAGPHIVPAA
ncbi:MAG: hypothetical protein ABIZ91_07975 [Gemmatimonadaceae bacterium]